jgi:hypothetical protein
MLPRCPPFLSARVLLVAILYDVCCVSCLVYFWASLCCSLRWLYKPRTLGSWDLGTTREEQVQVTAWRGLYNWLLRGSACPGARDRWGSLRCYVLCMLKCAIVSYTVSFRQEYEGTQALRCKSRLQHMHVFSYVSVFCQRVPC